ncbi:MAG: radical SAM protein [Candidatus Omnitrophica bacterium]|nr:radical SAM protein [Candidatus Omnitrophota bacterium]
MGNKTLRLLLADRKGRIFEHASLEPAGMKAGKFFRLGEEDLIKVPAGSQLFRLPDRKPVGYDPWTGCFITIDNAFAVAAFASPGHTLTHNTAYTEDGPAGPLPLFSYGACASYNGNTYVTAIQVDKDKRHDTTLTDPARVRKNISKFKKLFRKNRLIGHLAICATEYGCPNAQNFFLSRYEAPLPTSPSCNAGCAGCISYQGGKIKCSQPRIKFVPSKEEITEIALYHIANVKDAIVSFGQGCEGEPLLQAELIEDSIKMIRRQTNRGTINLNTNGSKPEAVSKLFDSGLDTIRISLNSARENYYSLYYRPRGYSFRDVLTSITVSKKKGLFVSLNYLTMPGFTDSKAEMDALMELLAKTGVDMIQWRNLNYDPMRYFKLLDVAAGEMAGIAQEIDLLKERFPRLRMGYFNPRAAASRRR